MFLTHAYDDIADLLSENERLQAELIACQALAEGMRIRAALPSAGHTTKKPKPRKDHQ